MQAMSGILFWYEVVVSGYFVPFDETSFLLDNNGKQSHGYVIFV